MKRIITTTAGILATFVSLAGEEDNRVADYVSPAFLESGSAISDTVVATCKIKTDADRWMAFEREYGIQTPEPTWILGAIQIAKFELDKLTFDAKETIRKLEFSYDIGGSRPGSHGIPERTDFSLPLFGKFGQPQLRSVITEHDPIVSKAFVGLQLRVPFGQGAAEYR